MTSTSHLQKRLTLLVFLIAMGLLMLFAMNQKAYASEEVASGACGNNITWTFDDEGTLSFQGAGEMPSYFNNTGARPWNEYMEDVQRIVINEGITSVGDDAFVYGYSLVNVSLPNSLTSMGKEVFTYCKALEQITIPDSVTDIGSAAFYECGIKSIHLPDALTIISENLFYGCSHLTTVEIPANLIRIDPYAFASCDDLTNLFIPKSVESIGNGAFHSYQLKVEIDSNSTHFTTENDVLYSKDMTELLWIPYSSSDIDYRTPDSVSTIKKGAVSEYTKRTNSNSSLILPFRFSNFILSDTVTTIEKNAFFSTTISNLQLSKSTARYVGNSFNQCKISNIVLCRGKAPNCPATAFSGSTIGTIHVPIGASGYDIAPWSSGTVVYDLDAIPLEGISLNYPEITISTEDSVQLAVSPIPEDATEAYSVQWGSNNESVATVNSNGLVSILSAGEAIITATTDAGSATCTITVPETAMQTYDLTITNGSGSGKYRAGKVVTIKEIISDKYKSFVSWEIVSGNATISDIYTSETTITMPAEDVEVKANYELTELGQALADLDEAIAAKEAAEASLAQAQADLTTAQATITQLNAAVESKDATIEEKEAALEQASADLAAANTALAKAQEDLTAAEAQLTAANGTIAGLQGTIEGKDEELAQASADLQAAQTQLAETQAALATATTNYNNTKAELDAATTTIADLRAQLAASQTDLQTAIEDKEKAEADLAAMTEALTAAEEAEAQAKAEAQAAKEAETQAKAEAETAKKAEEEALAALDAANQTVEELTQHKAELENQLAEAGASNEGLQAELDRVNAELTTANQNLTGAEAVAAAATEAKNQALAALEIAQSEKQQAIDARDAAIREKEEAETRAKEAEAEVERLKALTITANIKNATISGLSDTTYTGLAITPPITVKLNDKTLVERDDYAVYYVNNNDVGTATVIVTGEGNYNGVCKATFNIMNASIKEAKVSGNNNATYTGSSITPKILVTLGEKVLNEGIDYNVAYANNVSVGTASITITGKGNYEGSRTASFSITKATNPISVKTKAQIVKSTAVKKKKQVMAAKKAFAVTQAQGKVSYTKTSGNSKIRITSAGKIIVKKGLKKGTYKVRIKVTAAGNSNYESGSKTVTLTIKIK